MIYFHKKKCIRIVSCMIHWIVIPCPVIHWLLGQLQAQTSSLGALWVAVVKILARLRSADLFWVDISQNPGLEIGVSSNHSWKHFTHPSSFKQLHFGHELNLKRLPLEIGCWSEVFGSPGLCVGMVAGGAPLPSLTGASSWFVRVAEHWKGQPCQQQNAQDLAQHQHTQGPALTDTYPEEFGFICQVLFPSAVWRSIYWRSAWCLQATLDHYDFQRENRVNEA